LQVAVSPCVTPALETFPTISRSSDFVFDVGESLNAANASPEDANYEANDQFALDL
jgi:hypothetical protein